MKSASLIRHAATAPIRYDTVFLLDVSQSMDATDWGPTRLHGARTSLQRLLHVKADDHPDDRVGIVTFTDIIVVRHPLVRVGGQMQSLMDSVQNIVTGPSTAMADGLKVAHSLLPNQTQSLRQIIVLTDGEHNQGPDPVPIAQEIKENGLVIVVVGIGSPSSLDQTSLRKIASPRLDGSPSYSFIGDVEDLCAEMVRLAHHHIMMV